MVGAGGIQQQQRVPGGCGIDDDEAAPGFAEHPGELLEYRDLLGAGGQQVLGQHRPSGFVQVFALRGHHMVAVGLDRRHGIDAGDLQAVDGAVQCLGEVRRRVRGGQVHLAARLGQRDGDGRGDGGLADPALAHAHDQSVIGPQDLADQPGQGRIGEIRQ